MNNKLRRGAFALLTTAAAAALLVACGGGGGSGGGSAAADPPAGSTVVTTSPSGVAQLGDCEMFPPEAVFNTRIDDAGRFPAHPNSAAWIAMVGASTPFRADWWRFEDPTRRDQYYGFPYNVVDGSAATTDWVNVRYDYTGSGVSNEVGWPHESDCAVEDGAGGHTLKRGCSTVPVNQRRFPLPRQNLKLEASDCNDPNTCGDHHVAVVEQGACRLWEAYKAYPVNGQWYMLSSAAWDLKSLSMRPATWTSADAAGLPMLPLVAKAAEADSGEIRHALRVTFRDEVLARDAVWPARHFAGGDTPGGIPFGALLRLKADFVIPEQWSPHAKALATAAKRYGLYVADIGMDFYVAGEPSVAWNDPMFREVSTIPLSAMEFVDLGSITRDARFSADSMAASWN